MISRLSGRLLSLSDGLCELEVQGVAYAVRVGDRRMPPAGSDLVLFTHLHQRDEEPSLFGFLEAEEKRIFSLLLGVHGVGPKLAQAAVVALGPGGLAAAIREKNFPVLTKVPGLGRKRAETLVQELKEKIQQAAGSGQRTAPGDQDDAAEGLRALGYKDEEIVAALAVAAKGSTEERLREAIRWLGGRR